MSLINELIINGINSNKFKKILFIHQLLMQQRCGKKNPWQAGDRDESEQNSQQRVKVLGMRPINPSCSTWDLTCPGD